MAEDEKDLNLPLEALGVNHPEKRIKNVNDLQTWYASEAYYDLVGFINGISTAIQGYRLDDPYFVSPNMNKLLEMFDKFHEMIDATPPVDQPQRFGNKAYRQWWSKMNHDIFRILQDTLPVEQCRLINELGFYLAESFGNAVRIDYGTGHELSFTFFMCALFKGQVLNEQDSVATGLSLFYKYLLLVRRLQTTYRMEPAGSHGVWSLDDYQFIPFIWGSAQLACNSPFSPHKFLDDDIIEQYSDAYMFISCIKFIKEVKTGHFAEHSNQLWSISAVASWVKINSGLVKMYRNDVLSKFPIMQHMYFSPLMSYNAVKPGAKIVGAYLGEESEMAQRNKKYLEENRRSSETSASSQNLPPPSSKLKGHVQLTEAVGNAVRESVADERKAEEMGTFEVLELMK